MANFTTTVTNTDVAIVVVVAVTAVIVVVAVTTFGVVIARLPRSLSLRGRNMSVLLRFPRPRLLRLIVAVREANCSVRRRTKSDWESPAGKAAARSGEDSVSAALYSR